MNTTLALLDTINAKSLVEASGSSLSEYFSTQFAALTPMKVVIALLMGFLVLPLWVKVPASHILPNVIYLEWLVCIVTYTVVYMICPNKKEA